MLCSPLLGTLRELERLYRDAEQALVATPSQGLVAAECGSGSAAARAALFDDDLDLGGQRRADPGGESCLLYLLVKAKEPILQMSFAHFYLPQHETRPGV